MANVFDVAKYILKEIGGTISTMKLQKLCYYSQAWTLVWDNGKPLFDEDFYRWDNGPVCRDLFNIHKGIFSISSDKIPDCYLSEEGLTDKQRQNINQIIEDYGIYSGTQLSELTHHERPWHDTLKDAIISKNEMRDYYRALIKSHV